MKSLLKRPHQKRSSQQILLQSRKNNLILVGEPGVGKTGIVEGFAQLLAEGKLPDALGRPAVIEISLTSLVAGTKYRGEFEDQLEAVIILTSNLGTGEAKKRRRKGEEEEDGVWDGGRWRRARRPRHGERGDPAALAEGSDEPTAEGGAFQTAGNGDSAGRSREAHRGGAAEW